MRILFVENHAIFARIVIQEFLSAHSVSVAPSLVSARALLAASPFDLALVDYDLDDGKGDEFVRDLAANHPDIPAVAVSSHDRGNAALVAAGAIATCAKTEFAGIQAIMASIAKRTKRESNHDT